MATGRLAGIARHDRPRGPMETIGRAAVSAAAGIAGDYRGTAFSGAKAKRQVSLIEAESWIAAMAELGLSGEEAIGWEERRANLLVEGLRLPREPGRVIAIGPTVRIETTVECDPCGRMEEVRPGLRAALAPDWRGGVLGKVVRDGEIAVGDEVAIL